MCSTVPGWEMSDWACGNNLKSDRNLNTGRNVRLRLLKRMWAWSARNLEAKCDTSKITSIGRLFVYSVYRTTTCNEQHFPSRNEKKGGTKMFSVIDRVQKGGRADVPMLQRKKAADMTGWIKAQHTYKNPTPASPGSFPSHLKINPFDCF